MSQKRLFNLESEIEDIEEQIDEEWELLKNDKIRELEKKLLPLNKEKLKLKYRIKKENMKDITINNSN